MVGGLSIHIFGICQTYSFLQSESCPSSYGMNTIADLGQHGDDY